jgi:hypothetical protein
MGILTITKICTDYHYKKKHNANRRLSQALSHTYGCEFPEIKKKALVGGSDQVEPGNEIIFKQDSVFLKFYT